MEDLRSFRERFGDDEEALRRELEELESSVAPDLSRRHGIVGRLAEICLERKQFDEADHFAARLVELAVEEYGPIHIRVAGSLSSLATIRRKWGNWEEAKVPFYRAIEVARQVPATRTLEQGQEFLRNARDLFARGYVEEAVLDLELACPILLRHLGPDHRDYLRALQFLATAYSEIPDLDSARPIQKELLEHWRRNGGEQNGMLETALQNMARLESRAGALVEALEYFLEWRDLCLQAYGYYDLLTANAYAELGGCLRYMKRWEEAKEILEMALEIYKELDASRHPGSIEPRLDLAWVEGNTGGLQAAQSLYHEALDIQIETTGEIHPEVHRILKILASFHGMRGRHDIADQLDEDVRRIKKALEDRPANA
ncbi:tetratricopeptide repeat protein [bacterium]|nr:tetratricopeptide repeat protein [bacterium]